MTSAITVDFGIAVIDVLELEALLLVKEIDEAKQ